jgi:hypothetical protein
MKTLTIVRNSIILISILLSWITFFFLSDEALINITLEDHFFEWTGALFLLASSILFCIAFIKSTDGNDVFLFKTNKNYFFLVLTLLFFFGFGEEISWGQRIFNLRTPELLMRINDQQEITIHNLKYFRGILNFNHLFTYFWGTYCVIAPLLYKKSPVVTKFIDRINLPMVPIWLGMFFLFSYAISIAYKFAFPNLLHPISEVKETSLCSLFFIFSIICVLNNHHKHSLNPQLKV